MYVVFAEEFEEFVDLSRNTYPTLEQAFAQVCCRAGCNYHFEQEQSGWRLVLTDESCLKEQGFDFRSRRDVVDVHGGFDQRPRLRVPVAEEILADTLLEILSFTDVQDTAVLLVVFPEVTAGLVRHRVKTILQGHNAR